MSLKDALKKVIDDAKHQMDKESALSIINEHMGTPVNSTNKNKQPQLNKGQSSVQRKIELIPEQAMTLLKYLYKQKFSIPNRSTKSIECFEDFAFRVYNKNRHHSCLDLSNLNISIQNHEVLNKILLNHTRVNFSSIDLDFKKIDNLFHPNLCEIILNNCGLTNISINYLLRRLQSTNITKLDLSSKQLDKKNKLTDTSELYDLIEISSTLAILELADIGLTSTNCSDIFQYLRQSTVVSVNLSRNEEIVGTTKHLSILKLQNNKIKSLKGISFKECNFQLIDLSRNKLQVRHMESLFKTQIINIKDLVLDQNPLGNIDLLQKFLIEKAHINSLSLRKCYLSDDSIRALFNGIETNNHIDKLNISNNSISKEACKTITESLRKIRLKSLNLSQCQIVDEAGQLLANQLVYNRKLRNLNLSQNRLSHLSGSALTLSLRTNRALLNLNISENVISYKYTKQIEQWVKYNNYLDESSNRVKTVLTQEPEKFDIEEDELNVQTTKTLKNQLKRDVDRLTAQSNRLSNNKQLYDELEQVFNIIDNNGSEKINNLMDQLDVLQGQINQQKQIKNQINRKSITPS